MPISFLIYVSPTAKKWSTKVLGSFSPALLVSVVKVAGKCFEIRTCFWWGKKPEEIQKTSYLWLSSIKNPDETFLLVASFPQGWLQPSFFYSFFCLSVSVSLKGSAVPVSKSQVWLHCNKDFCGMSQLMRKPYLSPICFTSFPQHDQN